MAKAEVHPCLEEAMSDGAQSLTPTNFAQLMSERAVLAKVVGRSTVA